MFEEANDDLEMRQNARILLQDEEEQPEPLDQHMEDGDSHDMVALVNSLQALGVSPLDATSYATQVIHHHRRARRPACVETTLWCVAA